MSFIAIVTLLCMASPFFSPFVVISGGAARGGQTVIKLDLDSDDDDANLVA